MGIETLQETTDRYSRMTIERRVYSRGRMRLSIKSCGRLEWRDSEGSVEPLQYVANLVSKLEKNLAHRGLGALGPRMRQG